MDCKARPDPDHWAREEGGAVADACSPRSDARHLQAVRGISHVPHSHRKREHQQMLHYHPDSKMHEAQHMDHGEVRNRYDQPSAMMRRNGRLCPRHHEHVDCGVGETVQAADPSTTRGL